MIALADYLEGGRVFLSDPQTIDIYTKWIELARRLADREFALKDFGAAPVDAGVREALIDALAGLKYIEPAIPVLRTMFMTADLALGARKAEEMDASNKEAIKKLEAVLAALSSQPVVRVDQKEIQTTMPKPQQNI